MNNRLYKLMNWPQIEAIVYAESDKPSEVLGPHSAGASTLYQTFIPGAKEVRLRIPDEDKAIKMEEVDEAGFYALLRGGKTATEYVYIAEYEDGSIAKIEDAYRYKLPNVDKELKKISLGEADDAYNVLGAHLISIDSVDGAMFRIWAPNARRVSVVGSFNKWDGRVHQMNRNDAFGVFELFVPGVKEGDRYQFEISMKGGLCKTVLDPYANASVKTEEGYKSVVSNNHFEWTDEAFIKGRVDEKDASGVPVSIYECDLQLNSNKYKETYISMAEKIAAHAVEMGYTHVELKPVAEYSAEESCGYETIMYYAPTCRYGTPAEFAEMINIFHKNNLKVILDWTLAHPSSAEGVLRKIDGTSCYEHVDPRQGIHPEWGTLLFNYGRGEVVSFLKSNALYWIEQFHIDGIRIDSLASVLCLDYGRNNGEWIANMYGGHENLEALDFIKQLNNTIRRKHPGIITVAEDSSAWPKVTSEVEDGGLGFTYKWNIGWRDDYIRYISKDPLYRAGNHNDLTLSMLYCYSDRFVLPLSSDCDNLLGIMPGDDAAKRSGVKLSLAYLMTHPGVKLISNGYDSYKAPKDGIKKLVKGLNELYLKNKALYELDDEDAGFEWINSMDSAGSTLSYIRKGTKDKNFLIVVLNCAGIEQDINVGVPIPGKYTRILNTESTTYGGSVKGKEKPFYSIDGEIDGRPYYINVTLPALSLSIFEYEVFDENDREYMLKLQQEAKSKADEAKARAKSEEAKAKAAEKKAVAEQKKAEEAARIAEEARIRAEKEFAKATEEMEKAREAMEIAREAAKQAEIAAHRLDVTEKSMKIK